MTSENELLHILHEFDVTENKQASRLSEGNMNEKLDRAGDRKMSRRVECGGMERAETNNLGRPLHAGPCGPSSVSLGTQDLPILAAAQKAAWVDPANAYKASVTRS